MNRYTIIVFLLLFFTVSSCSLLRPVSGSGHKIAIADTPAVIDSPVIIIPHIIAAAVTPGESGGASQPMISMLSPVFDRRIPYTTFSGKAKVRYSGPDQKQEITAHIRMTRDSVIWVYVTALGGVVHAATILITPDSFFMVNYLDQEVTKIALKDAAKILPAKVDFSSLQNFIIGDPLRKGAIKNVTDNGSNWSLVAEDTAFIQKYTYNKADTLLESAQLSTHKPGGMEADLHYSNYLSLNDRKISSLRAIDIQKSTDSTYSLDMNFTKIDLDQPQEYPFSIPANYQVK